MIYRAFIFRFYLWIWFTLTHLTLISLALSFPSASERGQLILVWTYLCQLYKRNIVEYYFSIDLSFILNMKNQISPHILCIFVTVWSACLPAKERVLFLYCTEHESAIFRDCAVSVVVLFTSWSIFNKSVEKLNSSVLINDWVSISLICTWKSATSFISARHHSIRSWRASSCLTSSFH